MNTFGERLKEERKRLGLNQTDFAAAGGVQKRAQVSYEQNERFPDVAYLMSIKDIGADICYLLKGEVCDSTLNKEETDLLVGFRGLDSRGKVGVIALMNGLTLEPVNSIRGDVGQIINGDVSTQSLSFSVGGKKKS